MAMDFHLRTDQKLQQRLQMSPQLYQVVEILQLTIAELQARIEQEVAENPFLEIVEGSVSSPAQVQDEMVIEGSTEALNQEKAGETKDVWDAMAENDDFGLHTRTASFSGDEDPKLEAMMNTAAPSISLSEHLSMQLHLLDLPAPVLEACEVLASALDSRGYLRPDYWVYFENVMYESEEERRAFTNEEINEAFRIIRTLDPAGVGAVSASDCLLLQLEQMEGDLQVEKAIVSNHLEDLAANKLPEIAKALSVPIERVIEAREKIRTLNPRPGLEYDNTPPQYITVDVLVKERDGELEVMLNESAMPRLRFNRHLLSSIRPRDLSKDEKKFIATKKESAQALLNAVSQRNRILLTIVSKTTEHQRDYYLKGRKYLKPLLMKDLADELGIDVSTVSRAVSGKYVDCPQGIIPIRELFTAGYTKADGDLVSDEAVKERLKALISGENPQKPLSDQEIATIFNKEGVSISRRTVTKYREELEIPNSRLRKKY
ncbi:MAG: RNA polymerase factor sigma-54 [Planctomycetota bacterium]